MFWPTESKDGHYSFVAFFVGENEQPEGRRPPGFEGVPVLLRGASCIAFFSTKFFWTWSMKSQRLCDKSFKLLGQLSYNEEFDFRFQKQASSFSGYGDF